MTIRQKQQPNGFELTEIPRSLGGEVPCSLGETARDRFTRYQFAAHPWSADEDPSGFLGQRIVRQIFTWDLTNPGDGKPVPPSLLDQGKLNYELIINDNLAGQIAVIFLEIELLSIQ